MGNQDIDSFIQNNLFKIDDDFLTLEDLLDNKKNKSISIECKNMEIGTKYEKNNEEENIKMQKDYYNKSKKEMFFFPFFNMIKENNKLIEYRYYLIYYLNDRYNLYIYKRSSGEEIKIQINNKSIVQILHNRDTNNIELYIFLKTSPKVYRKSNKNTSFNKFFFENFKNKIDNYTYDNFYRNIDKNNPEKYFKVKHDKKLNNNIIYDIENLEDIKNERDVSYFSMDDEFLNLYLNDLIIKVSFDNNNNNYELFQSIKKNLKE